MPHAPGPRTTETVWIGVMARTHGEAASLAQELNIRTSVPLSPRSTQRVRGRHLGALLVAEDTWEDYQIYRGEILPALHHHRGYVLKISRTDPWKNRS